MNKLATATQPTMYENVLNQFNLAAETMNLNAGIRNILAAPDKEIVVNFPVKLDNGDIKIFTGYRVQHNNALGPYKGGLRYHASVDLESARALAMWMTWKTSLAGLPYGGGKGGIQLDPKLYSQAELERITRRFTYALGDNIGPDLDIPAPDVNTNSQIMAWMADTYASTKSPLTRFNNLHVVTGKPMGTGGLQGRDRATGYGVVASIKLWAKYRNIKLSECSYSVQGFGNVGYWTAHFMNLLGAKLVAVQDAVATIYNPEGINPEALYAYCGNNNKSIANFSDAEEINNELFFSLACDIIVPAALGNQITEKNAFTIQAKLIAEGANGPTDTDGEEILREKGIDILPDILCNSGGVIGSYYEWLQNKRSETYKLPYVLEAIDEKIEDAFAQILAVSDEFKCNWRTSAYVVALRRIEQTYLERGVFP